MQSSVAVALESAPEAVIKAPSALRNALTHLSGAGSKKVKPLPVAILKEVEQKNRARRLAGLTPIIVKVRSCICCGCSFESAGNRNCGCTLRCTGALGGRDVI